MKLTTLHESVLPFIVIVSGLGFAVYAGLSIAQGQFGTLGLVFGAGLAITILLILRERVWLLIPFLWGLSGKIPVLPLPFTIRQLAVLYVASAFLALKAFKLYRRKPTKDTLDVWLWVILFYMATVFIRNPVGVEALGSARVGGKPYFEIIIAYAAYWVLRHAVARPFEALLLPVLVVASNAFELVLNMVADHFPSTAPILRQFYSGISAGAEEANSASAAPPGEEERETYLAGIGSATALLTFSFWRPFTVINPIYFGRFLLFAFAIRAVMLSGFRSILMMVMASFLISSYFRRGMLEVFRAAGIGALALSVIILLQGNLINLPLSAQRALSFLPGKWDYLAKKEAESSTEWRVEMWKAMLSGNKYIENKWLGDGFGFTRRQLEIMTANASTGSTADQQENLMISGGVHSGPISAIRYAGYVGLCIFIVLLIMIARKAWFLIRKAQSTPYLPLALFFGIPAIWAPLNFVFIFGGFEGDLPSAIFTIGILKMIENCLDDTNKMDKKGTTEIKVIDGPHRRMPLNPTLQAR